MDYRNLGRTGVKVSPLCLGCMTFGRGTGEAEAMDMIDRALDAGLNFLDTANVYGRGASEEVVGKALQRNGSRQRVILATKVSGRMDDDDPNAAGITRRHIVEQCEASLRRLQTDWIDLYQLHRPESATAIDETLRALDDLVRAGKVRYLGTSMFPSWQIVESLWAAKELGLNRFVSEQPPYHLLDRSVERELAPMARTHGVALIPFSPLAGGILTGKYRRGEDPSSDSRLGRGGDPEQRALLLTDATYDAVEALASIADDKGCTPGQLALAWNMSQPGITAPIVGPRTRVQLEENLRALDVDLTEADQERLDTVFPPGGTVVPYYHADARGADWGPPHYRW
jgi:aryl-alcohol dehydrogenase-like predicted oxidoreductase